MTPSAPELDALWRTAFVRCRAAGASPDDAQDCAQHAIAELLARTGIDHPNAWVATVAYHRYIDVCRLRLKERSAGLVPGPAARMTDLTGPEELVIGRAHARWLVDRMVSWPVSTRAVCSALAAGVARTEIGVKLGLTSKAIESHLTRARRALRNLSLLTVAVALAVGRCVRLAGPSASKPVAIAAWVAPSVAAVLAAGSLCGGPCGTMPADVGGGPNGTRALAASPISTPPAPHPRLRPAAKPPSAGPLPAAPHEPVPTTTDVVVVHLDLPSLLNMASPTGAPAATVRPPVLPATLELIAPSPAELPLPAPELQHLPALSDIVDATGSLTELPSGPLIP